MPKYLTQFVQLWINFNVCFHLNSTNNQLLSFLLFNIIYKMKRIHHKDSESDIKKKNQIAKMLIKSFPNYLPELLALPQGYEIFPSAQQIFSQNYRVKSLKLKFKNTMLQWKGPINLSTLQQPLSHTINFDCNSVEVYLNDIGKPPKGKQLNRLCIGTFSPPKKIDKKKIEKYCDKYGLQLLMIDIDKNTFQVEIPHFTKYKFDETDEQKPVQQKQSIIVQHRSREVSYQSYARDRDNSGISVPNIQRIKSLEDERRSEGKFKNPTGALQNEVNQHNQLKNEYQETFSYESNFITFGKPFKITKIDNYIHFQPSKPQRQQESSQIKQFFDFLNTQQFLLQENIGNDIPNKMKRIFSLIQFCFNFTTTRLSFSSHSKELYYAQRTSRPNEQQKNMKDWVEWVINSEQYKQQPQNIIYQNLCKRNTNHLIQKYLDQENYELAEYLACIEDRLYRDDCSERPLNQQLDSIQMQNLQAVPQMNWMMHLGYCLWYFLRVNLIQKIKSVLQKHKNSVDSFKDQFRILQIFLGQENKAEPKMKLVYEKKYSKLSQFLYTWYTSLKLNDYEKQHFQNAQQYSKYRYRLLRQIIYRLESVENMVCVLKNENYVNEIDKQIILRQVIMRRPYLCQPLTIVNYENQQNQQNIANQVKGVDQMSRFNYLQALTNFCKQNTHKKVKRVERDVVGICSNPELFLNIKYSVTVEYLKLLQRINLQQLYPLVTYTQIRLQVDLISEQNIGRICGFAKKLNNAIKNVFMSLIAPIILKSILFDNRENEVLFNQIIQLYADNKIVSDKLKLKRYRN